jgi:hypothetical protein
MQFVLEKTVTPRLLNKEFSPDSSAERRSCRNVEILHMVLVISTCFPSIQFP